MNEYKINSVQWPIIINDVRFSLVESRYFITLEINKGKEVIEIRDFVLEEVMKRAEEQLSQDTYKKFEKSVAKLLN